jgi:hypothetical protein
MKVRRSKNCEVTERIEGKGCRRGRFEKLARLDCGWGVVWVSEKGVRYGLGAALDYGSVAWALD